MPEKILFVDGDQATLNWLKAKFAKEGFDVDTANRGDLAWSKIQADPPDILITELTLPDLTGLELVRRVKQDSHYRYVGMFILSLRTDPQDIAASLDAGAEQYIMKRPGSDIELIAKIRARKAQSKKNTGLGSMQELGNQFSFCSAKGGSGTTSVCINTAYALAKLSHGADIVVVDMVLPLGTIGLSLGYKSENTVARLSNLGVKALDPSLIKKYVSPPLRWGFRVLIGANNPNEATSIDIELVRDLFMNLRQIYDYVLVDFGRMLSRLSLPILETSNGIILIVTPDMSTVHSTRLVAEYLQSHNISRNQLILVNNRTVGRVWTTTQDIEREIQLPLMETLPYEVEHMTMAINDAVPFMEKFPNNAACMGFTDLARQLLQRAKQATG
ncbi:MAG: response regulator [Chloroflexi bacterium]|nr:response regulator [Chloroflexota bacterium]